MRSAVGALVVELVRGDITNQPDVDAVVNAANSQLAPGGGVAGAIHRAAGRGLYDECRPLAPIGAGQAVITSAHGLPNKHVIHTLGPVYSQSSDPPGELASCYRESLARADEAGLASVAFPAISTGIFGYPIDEAAEVSIRAVAGEAPKLRSVKLVRFVLFADADVGAFRSALDQTLRS